MKVLPISFFIPCINEQAIIVLSLQIYGDGTQTRSFQYVTDLVNGMISLMNNNYSLPVNLGNPEEHTISEFAQIIRELSGEFKEIVIEVYN